MKVMIAVPHTGTLSSGLAISLLSISHDAIARGIDLAFHFEKKIPHDGARNAIVKAFLESGREWLISIDSDITPPLNLLEILDPSRLVVAALCNIIPHHGSPQAVIFRKPANFDGLQYEYVEPVAGEILPIDAFGTGCYAIHRSVLAALPKPCFKFVYDAEGICTQGEDLYFSTQLTKHGFQPYADCRFPCLHKKSVLL